MSLDLPAALSTQRHGAAHRATAVASATCEPTHPNSATDTTFERLYTVQDLAKQWSLSTVTIRRLFEREPGTLVLTLRRPGKRRYRTVRIPRSVAERVYRKLTT